MTTPEPTADDPGREAAETAGLSYTVRILEPSRPAVNEPPFFADNPAATGSATAGTLVLTPHAGGDRSWDDLVSERPEISEFAADRWLGARRGLGPVPPDYVASLVDFHRVAYSVIAVARRLANTKFGLRFTRGGFGTPFFGADVQVRVVGDWLVVQEGDDVRFERLTTLRAAGEFVGVVPDGVAAEHDSPELGDLDRPLATRSDVGDFLGDWFGFATALLEDLLGTAAAAEAEAERVQLWPGHFDPAVDIGDADTNSRASYGFSPGDHAHDEPYIYVAAHGDVDRSNDYWGEVNFAGASLSYAELLASPDGYERARRFLLTGYELLNV